jgi:hypothetical protein
MLPRRCLRAAADSSRQLSVRFIALPHQGTILRRRKSPIPAIGRVEATVPQRADAATALADHGPTLCIDFFKVSNTCAAKWAAFDLVGSHDKGGQMMCRGLCTCLACV